jgi:hypothetical protein
MGRKLTAALAGNFGWKRNIRNGGIATECAAMAGTAFEMCPTISEYV